MKALLLTALLAAGLVNADSAIAIRSHARIYVDAVTGFDVYLATALEKKHVPLVVTADKSRADYAIEEVSNAGQAGIRLVDLRSGDVVTAWPGEAKSTLYSQKTAEACAKRLATSIYSPAKHRSSSFAKDPVWDF